MTGINIEGCSYRARTALYTVACRGSDRVRFLNGMLSNDVGRLSTGRGHFAVKANHKGHMEGLIRVRCGADAVLLDIEGTAAEVVAGALVTHLVADDCELVDMSEGRQVLQLVGLGSTDVVGAVADGARSLDDAAFLEVDGLTIIRDMRLGIDGFELHVPDALAASVIDKLEAASAQPASDDAFEAVRIEAGVPAEGIELDSTVIPMEAGLHFAIDYKKGCYIGQETIARATNLGGVKHRMVGLSFTGDAMPAVDLRLFDVETGKDVGEITSVAWSARAAGVVGLGYARITHAEPGTELRIGDGEERVEVSALPFVPPRRASTAFPVHAR